MIVTPPLKVTGGSGHTTVYLPAGTTSWTVPSGVTSLLSIELWGSGGDGGFNPGGGGAYTKVVNIPVTPGTVFSTNIPFHNPNIGSSLYTWFDTALTYKAEGGQAGSTFDIGTGGKAANGIGTTKHNGGNGGTNFGGGGAAAGPNGDGGHGGDASGGPASGAGAGGSDGGGNGSDNNGTGDGGTNNAGQPGGIFPGGNATNPGSGGAGAGIYPSVGGDGADDPDKGGGGGGGGPLNNPGTNGGAGAQPGGGAGGARFAAFSAIGGDGQIKIVY